MGRGGKGGSLVWAPEVESALQLSVTLLFMSLGAFRDGNVV